MMDGSRYGYCSNKVQPGPSSLGTGLERDPPIMGLLASVCVKSRSLRSVPHGADGMGVTYPRVRPTVRAGEKMAKAAPVKNARICSGTSMSPLYGHAELVVETLTLDPIRLVTQLSDHSSRQNTSTRQ